MKKGTKILSLAAALMLTSSVFALTGCKEDTSYKGEETRAEYDATAKGQAVSSNGGFVVEKGGYVYFINGEESTTANNGYGTPVKGSLMCIKKTDLESGAYDKAKIVIPSLFTAQDFTSGLYIYGDYVYYATPTTDKNVSGETGNSYVDFKRSKLDGSETPMDGYYLRLPASTVYRFVQVDGTDRNNDGENDVFCLYEDGTTLKSYNTATSEDTVLVKGASDYFYDTKDLTNPNVYYVMSVTYGAETLNPTTPGYNQIYCVDAAAKVKAVDSAKASYTVAYSDGEEKTYDFDEKAMNDNAGDRGYNLGDYTTYPYVNLGELILDGVGSASSLHTHYNEVAKENITDEIAKEKQGYTYTIKRYETSGAFVGLYFTRTAVVKTGNEVEKLYYVDESEALKDGWNTVDANNSVDIIAHAATDVPDASIIEVSKVNDKRAFTYIYSASETADDGTANHVIRKVTVTQGEKYGDLSKEEVQLTNKASGENDTSAVTLWKTHGDYLYYYKSGSKGKNLLRINYTGNKNNYHSLGASDEYKATNIAFVEYNKSWYQPEFISVGEGESKIEMLLYANMQNYGSSTTSFKYVYATKIGTTAELLQAEKDYKAYTDYRAEYESGDNADSDVVNLIKYLFGSNLAVTEEAKAEYIKKFNKSNNDADSAEGEEFYEAIVDKFDVTKEGYLKSASAYANCISRMTESDVEKIEEAWDNLLLYPEEEETVAEEETAAWKIVLIVGGSVLALLIVIVAAARHRKKKKAAKREADAIVNSYKRQRIDTTDDKTIDVYADENAEEKADEKEESASEETEESVEESTEEVSEEPAADAESEEKTE